MSAWVGLLTGPRDRRLGVNSQDKRADRATIQAPAIDSGADAWQHGTTIQIANPRKPQ
jgi:hypothetical protein